MGSDERNQKILNVSYYKLHAGHPEFCTFLKENGRKDVTNSEVENGKKSWILRELTLWGNLLECFLNNLNKTIHESQSFNLIRILLNNAAFLTAIELAELILSFFDVKQHIIQMVLVILFYLSSWSYATFFRFLTCSWNEKLVSARMCVDSRNINRSFALLHVTGQPYNVNSKYCEMPPVRPTCPTTNVLQRSVPYLTRLGGLLFPHLASREILN